MFEQTHKSNGHAGAPIPTPPAGENRSLPSFPEPTGWAQAWDGSALDERDSGGPLFDDGRKASSLR